MGEISIVIGNARDFPAERNFGATTEDGREIMLAPKLAAQRQDIIQGVVAHELGHAADFLYPALWYRDNHGEWYRAWKRTELDIWQRRTHDQVEHAADGIGESMFGCKIYYRGACRVQSTAAGVRPRPRGLR